MDNSVSATQHAPPSINCSCYVDTEASALWWPTVACTGILRGTSVSHITGKDSREYNNYAKLLRGGSVAELLACWTQAQKGPGLNRSRDAVG